MVKPAIRTESDRDAGFARWIGEVAGAETILQCIHCGQCSGSCPLSRHMDVSPRRLMHLAREGFKNDVLSSRSIWLCTSCYTCTLRCPRGIKVTAVLPGARSRTARIGTRAVRRRLTVSHCASSITP